jgi:hypothetical protein
MRPYAIHACDIKLLMHAAFSYVRVRTCVMRPKKNMPPQATNACGLELLAHAAFNYVGVRRCVMRPARSMPLVA